MAMTIRDRQAWTRRCANRRAEYLQKGAPRCQSPTATKGRQGGWRMAGLPLVARAGGRAVPQRSPRAGAGACDRRRRCRASRPRLCHRISNTASRDAQGVATAKSF